LARRARRAAPIRGRSPEERAQLDPTRIDPRDGL